MAINKDTKILIVGLGLIGGSYAWALSGQGFEVGGMARRNEVIDYALDRGWIAHGRTEMDPYYIGQFDLIVFALYPQALLEWLEKNQQYIKKGALLTDVTGVKRCVVYDVQKMLRSDLEFIGAHPMAGRESSGIENADKDIFKNANYIVTPTDANSQQAIDACMQLGKILGFRNISTLTPEKHDEMIGFLSQLTHCIAVSLMTCRNSESFVDYTGDSFRDLTRIAKINDRMWSELFLLNKDELVRQMELFERQFQTLKQYIIDGDTAGMREMMRRSTEQRKRFEVRKDD
ncbi:MAG: prephenate dehydrogenase [Acutalibacteraceae bacterium]